MKVFKNLFLSITALAAFASTSYAMEKPKALSPYQVVKKQIENKGGMDALLQKYPVSHDIKDFLDQNMHSKCIAVSQHGEKVSVRAFESLPEYFIKYEDGRMCGAALINEFAQKHSLNIRTAQKALYKDKEGTLFTVAKKVNKNDKPFCLKQIQELYQLIMGTYYRDCIDRNVFNIANNETCIIDTEEISFSNALNFFESFDCELALSRLQGLPMSEESKLWIDRKIEERKNEIVRINHKKQREANSDTLADTCSIS